MWGGGVVDKRIRILILEDDARDAELVERALHQAGICCLSKRVATRSDFIHELASFAPDLILADYRLPTFDGLEALRLTRAAYPDLPFIFVSGSIGEELAIETLKGGATDYVLKDHLARLEP